MGLTYANIAVTTLVGLWLTRFILRTVGQHDYGVWLLVLQSTMYLTLLDLGVVALLPRDVALIAAREQKDGTHGALAAHVGSTLRLVLWQLPIVALAGALLWLLVPDTWVSVRTPLGVIVAAFAIGFPLRAFPGILTGLQDLTFVGVATLICWAISTTTIVVLLLKGAGLYALVAGWVVQQLAQPLVCWLRLKRSHAAALPPTLPRVGWQEARVQLLRSLWVSIGGIAHVLVNASDVIVIGTLLGPAAVVPYVITGKLMSVLSNVPNTIAQAASPALSDLLVRESPERLAAALRVLTQTVIIASGAVACGILAVNEGFIRVWVGPQQYGGIELTIAIVVAAVMRHWALTLGMAAFAFGHERRLGIASIAEAVLTVGLMVVLVKRWGPIGAPLASLATVLVISIPATVGAVARASREPARRVLATVGPWAWRAAAMFTIAAVALRPWGARGLVPMLVSGTAAVLLYVVVMLPLALRPPLRGYLGRLRLGWLERLLPAA